MYLWNKNELEIAQGKGREQAKETFKKPCP